MIDKIARVLLGMQRLSWEQGVAAQAFFEAGYVEMALLMAEESIHRQTDDGRLGVCDSGLDAVDCGANGIPLWYAYQKTGDEHYLNAVKKMADWMKNAEKAENGLILHNIGLKKTMIDGSWHIAPMLAAIGEEDFAMNQLRLFRDIHFNHGKCLYSQYWDDERQCFERPEFWGPGNGWMAGALALTSVFVKDRSNKSQLKQWYKELIDACLGYKRDDGLFYNVLDDTETFVETTTPLMLAYSIYRAVETDLIDSSYLSEANHMTEGIVPCIDQNGYVRMACSSPGFNKPGVSAETQSFALMCLSRKIALYPFSC